MRNWFQKKRKENADLVKLYVDFLNNDEVGGESMWAEDIGNDLYRIRNVPFNAYGINFYDIVYAKAKSENLKPSITRVHEYKGHKTLRVIFLDESSVEERVARLKQLNEFKACFENVDGTLFAIDIEPEGDYGAVCDLLFEWENNGILSYETCESKSPDSFDVVPNKVLGD